MGRTGDLLKKAKKTWNILGVMVTLHPIIFFPTPMKRCNNCGWFNYDSAERCEKCDDESFEPIVSEAKVTETSQCENLKPVEHSEPVTKSPIMATVAFGSVEPASQPVRKSMAATVLDASAVLRDEVEVHCSKCRYPIIGAMDYCPNCGATVKSVNSGHQIPKVTRIETCEEDTKPSDFNANVMSSDLKATVRDVPVAMIQEEEDIYRLVPVDVLGEAVYEMHLGDIVSIGGRRYRFQK